MFVEAEELQAGVLHELIHRRLPGLQIPRRHLHGLHAVVPLVADLVDADELEVAHPQLELGDAVVEVGAPVVGDDCGRVLAAREGLELGNPEIHGRVVLRERRRQLLEGGEAAVDVGGALLLERREVVEALVPALRPLGRASLHVVETLEHHIELVAGVGFHGPERALLPREVGVEGGSNRIQPSPPPVERWS